MLEIPQLPPHLHRPVLILPLTPHQQLPSRPVTLLAHRQRTSNDAPRHPRTHLIPPLPPRQDRGATPHHIRGGGMRITLGGIEEQIHDACAGDMRAFGCDVGEDDAGGD